MLFTIIFILKNITCMGLLSLAQVYIVVGSIVFKLCLIEIKVNEL
jgi:hypothetical protein